MVGGIELRRWVCDLRFFTAMLKDSFRGHGSLVLTKVLLAVIYYLAVMLGGWASFQYASPIASKSDLMRLLR
jgi:hypothetical protein